MNIEGIISQMTLEDKIALCEGASFWESRAYEKYGIPSMFVCDGPSGLRKQDLSGGLDMLGINKSVPATCFPAAVTTAGSWDPELTKQVGNAIGEEALQQKVGVVLGPGCNLKRNPLCGRNFEYYSEDPLIAGKMAAAVTRGVQSCGGVGVSIKHFCCNNQEENRMMVSENLSGRALREVYLKAFRITVQEGKPWTVMSSYNRINGLHVCNNPKLLTGVLRDEWGFEGLVMSDWNATEQCSYAKAINAGNDLIMPGTANNRKALMKALKDGNLRKDALDIAAARVLTLVFNSATAEGF